MRRRPNFPTVIGPTFLTSPLAVKNLVKIDLFGLIKEEGGRSEIEGKKLTIL